MAGALILALASVQPAAATILHFQGKYTTKTVESYDAAGNAVAVVSDVDIAFPPLPTLT